MKTGAGAARAEKGREEFGLFVFVCGLFGIRTTFCKRSAVKATPSNGACLGCLQTAHTEVAKKERFKLWAFQHHFSNTKINYYEQVKG